MPIVPYVFFVAPVILCGILFVVGGNRGDRSFSTRFFVSLGVTVAAWISAVFIQQFAVVIVPVVCVLAIQKFCYIGWLRSILATVLYMAWMVGWPTLIHKLSH